MTNKLIKGFTCGAMDVFHAGHVLMMEDCKRHCDYLIVGVQSDPSIDRPEKNSPIQSHKERLGLVSSIKFVDEVRSYTTESSLIDLLKKINPDVRILGADHKGKHFTGYELNIKCIFNSRDHGYSTSELRKRVYIAEKDRSM